MKKEKQDNWRLIYDELEALNYDKVGQDILDMINEEEYSEMKKYSYERASEIEDFFFSYPALTWLLLHVGEEEIIFPLLVSQGLYLEEIPMKRHYIPYIRNEEDAKIVFQRFPNLEKQQTTKELLSKSPEGFIYWYYVAFPDQFYEDIDSFLLWSVDSDHIEELFFVLDKGKSLFSPSTLLRAAERIVTKSWQLLLELTIPKTWKDAVDLIVSLPKFTIQHREDFLESLARYKFNDAVLSIIKKEEIDSNNLLLYAEHNILSDILKYGTFNPPDANILSEIVKIHKRITEKLNVLLQYGEPAKNADDIPYFEAFDFYSVLTSDRIDYIRHTLFKKLSPKEKRVLSKVISDIIVKQEENIQRIRIILEDGRFSSSPHAAHLALSYGLWDMVALFAEYKGTPLWYGMIEEILNNDMYLTLESLLKENILTVEDFGEESFSLAIKKGYSKTFNVLLKYSELNSEDLYDLLIEAIQSYFE